MQGDVDAQNNLGVMYANGRGGLAKDEAEAVRWYRKAAAKRGPEVHREAIRKANAARSPEDRREAARKALAKRGTVVHGSAGRTH